MPKNKYFHPYWNLIGLCTKQDKQITVLSYGCKHEGTEFD